MEGDVVSDSFDVNASRFSGAFGVHSLATTVDVMVFLIPPIAISMSLFMKKNTPLLYMFSLKFCYITIVVTTISFLFGLRINSWLITIYYYLFLYFAFCFVLIRNVQGRSILVRVIVCIVCGSVITLGYVLVLTEPMGLSWDVYEMSLPAALLEIRSPYYCESSNSGSVFSEPGYEVILYKSYWFVPFLHRKIDELVFLDSDPTSEAQNEPCKVMLIRQGLASVVGSDKNYKIQGGIDG